ncbi:hypothetical protein EDB86DRAFT_3078384 [Lactarius hatsudake]|nr:hypothetical protein EDB86DRAFT_3078384 [Lactarius hatsudake]
MAQQGTATPTVLVPELLSSSPHFLLDDTINIENDGVGRAVDAMEDFLNRWAETRLEREPNWDADKELEQGLVSFQTLLEFHTDIAFDFFERLDFNRPPEKEAELLAEIDELWREIEKQKKLRLLLTKAMRTSGRHAKKAQVRLDRLAFLQPDQLRMLHALAADVGAFHASVSALFPLDPANTQSLLPEPGKREWELGKVGYISWVNAQLLRHANTATGSTLESFGRRDARGQACIWRAFHRVASVIASAEMARRVRECGALPTESGIATTIAQASRKATLDTANTMSMVPLDKVAVVAVHAVVGHAVVGSAAAIVYSALGRPAELVGTVEARDITATAQVVQLGRSEVDCLTVVVVGRRLLEHREKRRVHHAGPAIADDRGEPIETAGSDTAIGARGAEGRAGGETRKVGALWAG